jgi:hypothetical protein
MSEPIILKVETSGGKTLYCLANAYGELPNNHSIWCFLDPTGKNDSGWFFSRNDLTVQEN